MSDGKWYKTSEVAEWLRLRETRTKQLLKEILFEAEEMERLVSEAEKNDEMLQQNTTDENEKMLLMKRQRHY